MWELIIYEYRKNTANTRLNMITVVNDCHYFLLTIHAKRYITLIYDLANRY